MTAVIVIGLLTHFFRTSPNTTEAPELDSVRGQAESVDNQEEVGYSLIQTHD